MINEQGKEIVELKNQIVKQFTHTDWLEIGYIFDVTDIIIGHPRLLRSLTFKDDDYESCILPVLTKIVRKDPKNLQEIKSYISAKYSTPMVTDFISTAYHDAPKKTITFSPQVFTVPNKMQNNRLVAVMLPFKQIKTFEIIKTLCTEINLECKRADDIWENSTFIQDIFELIFTCEVVIADVTEKNPNVFYEIGIAHTLGKTVIPITQSIQDIPSDLIHHRALKYLPNKEGYEAMIHELRNRLLTLIPTDLL